jgi:hypothetical protein
MKRTIISLIITLSAVSAYSQQYVCRQDTVHFYQSEYRGKIQWQKSVDGVDWTALSGYHGDTISVVADGSAYSRSQFR